MVGVFASTRLSHLSKPLALALTALLASEVIPAARACDRSDLSEPELATVAAVLDGETLKLGDGRTVRLIGAKAPMPPLGWRGDDPWPFVAEAKFALETLALGRTVELRFAGRRTDRHGQLLAQVFVAEGRDRLWIQEEMVAKGMARVYSLLDNNACVPELLEREKEARAARLGLWGASIYRVIAAGDLDRLGRLIHTFQLVEGTVVAVGEGAGRLYLNFAQDWRSDFTVSIARKDIGAFAAAGLEPFALAGKQIRVRGTLIWRNGPMIEASHPEQIELLPQGETQARKDA